MKSSVRRIRALRSQQIDDLGLDGDVEGGDAFVGDDEPRIDREGPGDAGALALAAAHAARLAVGELAVEGDEIEQRADPAGDARAGGAMHARAPRPGSAPTVIRGLSAL